MNALHTIQPYWNGGTWVFDDLGRDLRQEPFVAGTPELIDVLLAAVGLPARKQFLLVFSDQSFPDNQVRLEWVREEDNGNWYRWGDGEGWLCPALLKYFETAPRKIYCRATRIG
ncbi:MAG TPA: DUF6717 family protein [Anaerolineales bacterium]